VTTGDRTGVPVRTLSGTVSRAEAGAAIGVVAPGLPRVTPPAGVTGRRSGGRWWIYHLGCSRLACSYERLPAGRSRKAGRCPYPSHCHVPVGTTRGHCSTGKVPTEAPRAPIGDHHPRRPASWRTQVGDAPCASSQWVQYPSPCHLATRDSCRAPRADARGRQEYPLLLHQMWDY